MSSGVAMLLWAVCLGCAQAQAPRPVPATPQAGAATTPGPPAAPGTPGTPQASGSTAPPPADGPVLMLVPPVAASPMLDSGCWVQLFDDRESVGEALTIGGPMALPTMADREGRRIGRRVDRLVTGPKATLTVHERRGFGDRTAVFGPGAREAAVPRKLGFTGRIESLRIDCPPADVPPAPDTGTAGMAAPTAPADPATPAVGTDRR